MEVMIMRLLLLVAAVSMTLAAHPQTAPPNEQGTIASMNTKAILQPCVSTSQASLDGLAFVVGERGAVTESSIVAMRDIGNLPDEAVPRADGTLSAAIDFVSLYALSGEEPIDLARKARQPFFVVD